MRAATPTTGAGAVLALVFCVAAVGLLGSTFVLGVLGATSAGMWTGTIGCVFLAAWLLASNGAARRRVKHATAPGRRVTQESRGPVAQASTK